MKRIVWELEDGRRKYSMNSDGPETYNDSELILMEKAFELNGCYGYTKDFGLFGAYEFLKQLGGKPIKIIGRTLEDANLPLTEGVIN